MFGYATYRVHVQLDRSQILTLQWPDLWSSSRIFVDGKEVVAYGKPGTSYADTEPGTGSDVLVFTPQTANFDILIQVSNYHIFINGISSSIRIGSHPAIPSWHDSVRRCRPC